jgi:hypothetical protein
VLQDWNDGRIPYFTLPPKRDSEVAGSAQLVPAWGADFVADQSASLAALRSVEDGAGSGGAAFFQADTLGAVRVDLDGMAAADDASGSGSGSDEDEDSGAGGRGALTIGSFMTPEPPLSCRRCQERWNGCWRPQRDFLCGEGGFATQKRLVVPSLSALILALHNFFLCRGDERQRGGGG